MSNYKPLIRRLIQAKRANVGDWFVPATFLTYSGEWVQAGPNPLSTDPSETWQLVSQNPMTLSVVLEHLYGNPANTGAQVRLPWATFLSEWATPSVTADKYGGYQNLWV